MEDIFKEELTEKEKAELRKIVNRVIEEYGETLELLSQYGNT